MGAWVSKAISTANSSWSSPWSALPPELLDLVLRRLSSLADRLRFATVCRHWLLAATRYSAPCLPRPLPWLNFDAGGGTITFRSLPAGERHSFRFGRRALCVASSGRWLLFEKSGRHRRPNNRRHFLKHPLTGRTVRLPGRCNEPVDLNPDGSHGALSGTRSSTRFSIAKVVVCSHDLVVARVNYRRSRPDVVVCCRPGTSPSWSTGLCNGRWYQDLTRHEGKLYTVTAEGDLFVHETAMDGDTGEPRVSRVELVIQAPPPLKYTLDGVYYASIDCVRTCYLVISRDNKMLMLCWIVPRDDSYNAEDSTRQMTIKVFEADFKTSQWLQVKSLGDQVLFVSSNFSRSVCASSHAHCENMRGNMIYFVDDGLRFCNFLPTSNPRTCGVYDMGSNTIQSISLGDLQISDQTKGSWYFP